MKCHAALLRPEFVKVDRRGFTLVEVLVAMTIGSLLVVSAVSATRALSGAREGVNARVERSQAARRAMEAVVGALRTVRRDPVEGEPVLVGRQHEGNAAIDLLVITDRRSRAEGPESDQQEVSFFVVRRPGMPGARASALMRRQDHALDEHPDDGGVATVVAEGIIGLDLRYDDGVDWRDTWSPLEPRPPQAVRVTVAAAGPEEPGRPGAPKVTVLSTVVAIQTSEPTEAPERAERNREEGGRR